MEASAPSSNIPNEIIRIILLQLAVKSIIRFQCVCKQWRSLIQDSDFKLSYGGQGRLIILSHEPKRGGSQNSRLLVVRSSSTTTTTTGQDLRLETYKWPLGEAAARPLIRGSDQYRVRALCSCNGFVLLAADERDILLWNPSTRCSTKVLKSPLPGLKSLDALAGLCYDSYTRDYKAVLLLPVPHYYDYDYPYPCVISAGLTNRKQWRRVNFPYSSPRGSFEFRNTFHWWASDIVRDWECDRGYLSEGDRNRNRNSIVYFDPVRDEFKILPTPELLRNDGEENWIVGLGVIDDCLSMACILHKEKQTKMMQVLIMKEYGRQESWMIAFAIQIMPQLTDTQGRYGLTFYSHKNNTQEEEVLFMRRSSDRQHVYVYDPKKDELKEVLMDFLKQNSGRGYFASMCFYVESFNCFPLQPHD